MIKNMSQQSLCQIKGSLKEIYYAALESVKPEKIIENKIKINENNNNLIVNDKVIGITDKIYVVGFGKAVMGMAIALEKLLGSRLIKGIISVPRGSKDKILNNNTTADSSKVINYRESSINNEPDNDTVSVTRDIIELVESLNETDTLIVLISGGGSALLSMPKPPVTLYEKLTISRKLFNSGANIKEVNFIRQKLSIVKAGGLALMAYPAYVIGFILSDIIDDPIELIASGPTVLNSIPSSDKIKNILIKYNLFDQLTDNLKNVLFSEKLHQQSTDPNKLCHVNNFIIGNNLLAIESAKLKCVDKGFTSVTLFNNVQGLVSQISTIYTKLCSLICKTFSESISLINFNQLINNDPDLSLLSSKANEIYQATKALRDKGLILIAGGEPSVLVIGSGKGGRNQELALTFSHDWYKIISNNQQFNLFDVVLLSASTDGQDGPTDASGAFGYSDINFTLLQLQKIINDKLNNNQIKDNVTTKQLIAEELKSINIFNVLQNNDSYNFYSRFKKGNDLLKTGFTGTNVMDLHFIYIKKKSSNISNDKDNLVSLEKHDFFTNLLS